MRSYTTNNNEEFKDKIKSGILSILVWSAILLFVFIYKIKPSQEEETKEVVTTMLVNFGDNRNGNGLEEPANQEGSLSAIATENLEEPEPVESKAEEPKVAIKPEPKEPVSNKVEDKKADVKEKVLTGNNNKVAVAKKEEAKSSSKTSSSKESTNSSSKTTASSSKSTTKGSATNANSPVGNGDGKGNAAIGNLLKGRGTKSGGQGNGTGLGNAGDPLGGDGDGDSKVGVDRKLIGYIPGTMGRGGSQPSHSCNAEGNITISYTVDKAGNVVSARRSGGLSDPCIVSTSISWVKKYVRAEKSTVSSTGSYKITF